MPNANWRGTVGMIKPTRGSGSLEELIRMLPEGIGVIPLFNNIRHGRIEEFRSAIPLYEEKIAELAEEQVDFIHAAGTPPFMLLGYRGEQELVEKWEKRFKIPISMSGSAVPVCPVSKHSSSGFTPASFMDDKSDRISESGFVNTISKTKSFRLGENFA